jgi:hypothetical protein
MAWKPTPRPEADPFALPLDAEQGYLLSRLDGTAGISDLSALTGLGTERVEALLEDLVRLGAVAPDPAGPGRVPEGAAPGDAPPPAEEEASGVDDASDEETRASRAQAAGHRQHFETRLHGAAVDARAALALRAEEPDLSALCFDPVAEVIAALLENPRFGPAQARLVAAHHRSAAGLESLGGRAAWAQDAGVRRALLRNPLLPASLFRRLWSSRRLQELFLAAVSREVPDQIRALARDALRAAFIQRGAEEKVELILGTEGRSLVFLAGLTVDGHTTALLCRRTYVSTLLIQNIARWSAAPPALIAHLLRQDAVRRNAQLRLMLERHPNAG